MGSSDGISRNVEVVSDNDPIVTVKLLCDGCNEEIETIEVFEDELESLPDRPLHDSPECSQKARS